jgi:hypothetical protein
MLIPLFIFLSFGFTILFRSKFKAFNNSMVRFLFRQPEGRIYRPLTGRILRITGICLIFVAGLLLVLFRSSHNQFLPYTFLAVAWVAFFLISLGANLEKSPADERIETEKPFILFLRSFQMQSTIKDDNAHEILLVNNFDDKINWIAVNDSREIFQRGGSQRLYLGNDEWEQKVEELMERASYIFLMYFQTPGIRWEMDRIIKKGLLSKCIFYFPFVPRNNISAKVYNAFGKEMQTTYGITLPKQSTDQFRTYQFLTFQSDGRTEFLKPGGSLYKIFNILPLLKRGNIHMQIYSRLHEVRRSMNCGAPRGLRTSLVVSTVVGYIFNLFLLGLIVLVVAFLVIGIKST